MVRSLVHELCVVGLDVPDSDVSFEVRVPEVRGRLDALFGSTVFEFKRDLRREREEAEVQLKRYIPERERATNRRYLGVATDGSEFVAYEITGGRLVRLNEHVPSLADPRALLRWLDTAITARANISPDPDVIRSEFGRDSLVYRRSMERLAELWQRAQANPQANLKRELWSRHLEFVYGTLIEPEELFLQHTYLTIVAKTMAVRALVDGPIPAGELLSGAPFASTGLNGAVETDFFDWVLLADGGTELVDRIARQVERFRLSEIEVDVLKAIYESLIDPRQRHYLGEYYTPDWLAESMCREMIDRPLQTRVLDPACGSGTFLFHAIRQYLDAAEAEGMPLQEALLGCTDHVLGIDVHPVAVLFSRITYLLAIGPERLRQRTVDLFIPVYLGDALQWDVRQLLTEEEVEIAVPGEPPLRFPGSVAGDPNLLDLVLRTMTQLADQGGTTRSFKAWINAKTALPEIDRKILVESYKQMRSLHASGRNHIWTYIVRNLTRPLWLSLRKGKPDLVVGNPPWLRYNAMSSALQNRFRDACRQRGLWTGGRVATHQDISAYFFARAVERYLGRNGRIAFVMPLACLSRAQYEGFRTGRFGPRRGQVAAFVHFDKIWTFDSDVQPLFKVPSCVIFAHRDVLTGRLPQTVTAYSGELPRRDATPKEARLALAKSEAPTPWAGSVTRGSPYRTLFKQGATIVPRRLMVVVPVEGGNIGVSRDAPLVISRVSAQDKRPWKDLSPLRGQVEPQFLRPLLLGTSIAPFRVIRPAMAVIPWDERRQMLLDKQAALDGGYLHLAKWLRAAEKAWKDHSSGSMSFREQLDYFGKLSSQFPIQRLRVAYAKAGTKPAAVVIDDDAAVIDHKLYWMGTTDIDEARYLCAILNSEAVRERVEHMQSQGLFGPRDFDKVMFNLPIPRFRAGDPLHRELLKLAQAAERIAATVPVPEGQSFQKVRRLIREELRTQGVSDKIDVRVTSLLDHALNNAERQHVTRRVGRTH